MYVSTWVCKGINTCAKKLRENLKFGKTLLINLVSLFIFKCRPKEATGAVIAKRTELFQVLYVCCHFIKICRLVPRELPGLGTEGFEEEYMEGTRAPHFILEQGMKATL
jgi:hypothetical protein